MTGAQDRGSEDVGTALLLNQLFAGLAGDRRQQQVGQPTLRHSVDKQVACRRTSHCRFRRRRRRSMSAVQIRAESGRKSVSENSVLVSLLISDERFSRRAGKMTVAGCARLHKSH